MLEVFALGVKVRDSIAIRITENPEYITKILVDKLQPVINNVTKISEKFAASWTKVDSLNTTMDSKIAVVLQPINHSLTTLANRYEKPAIKGALGEQEVLTILTDNFPTYTVNYTREGHKTDIQIESTQSGHQYLVEVKDREKGIAFNEIEKFKKNVRKNKDFKVGILFSLRSGINVLASQGRFTIQFRDQQYYIYVPNALKEREDLIVWIVILADQLAVLDRGLTDRQTGQLNELLNEFQEEMKLSKRCEAHLAALKRSVEALEEDMVPLLKIIQNATRKLNSALHKTIQVWIRRATITWMLLFN